MRPTCERPSDAQTNRPATCAAPISHTQAGSDSVLAKPSSSVSQVIAPRYRVGKRWMTRLNAGSYSVIAIATPSRAQAA